MKKYSYVGIAFIILIFGIYAVPKIVNKFKTPQLITIAKVPNFEFTNQDGELISNSFYDGKVYVVEFFFTTCPTICPIMNENMVKIVLELLNANSLKIIGSGAIRDQWGSFAFSFMPKNEKKIIGTIEGPVHGHKDQMREIRAESNYVLTLLTFLLQIEPFLNTFKSTVNIHTRSQGLIKKI